jgi:hypothetical protein
MVVVSFGRSIAFSFRFQPVAKEIPIRADFTMHLNRLSSSIHRCWNGVICTTAGRLI